MNVVRLLPFADADGPHNMAADEVLLEAAVGRDRLAALLRLVAGHAQPRLFSAARRPRIRPAAGRPPLGPPADRRRHAGPSPRTDLRPRPAARAAVAGPRRTVAGADARDRRRGAGRTRRRPGRRGAGSPVRDALLPPPHARRPADRPGQGRRQRPAPPARGAAPARRRPAGRQSAHAGLARRRRVDRPRPGASAVASAVADCFVRRTGWRLEPPTGPPRNANASTPWRRRSTPIPPGTPNAENGRAPAPRAPEGSWTERALAARRRAPAERAPYRPTTKPRSVGRTLRGRGVGTVGSIGGVRPCPFERFVGRPGDRGGTTEPSDAAAVRAARAPSAARPTRFSVRQILKTDSCCPFRS